MSQSMALSLVRSKIDGIVAAPCATMLRLAAALFLCHPAWSTECRCEQHPARAEANGTCSRTEDTKYCDLAFSTTPPAEYREFVVRLSKMNIIEPRKALQFAFETPPEQWSKNDLDTILPALFAISQRIRFQDLTQPIAIAVRSSRREDLYSAFTTREPAKFQKLQVGPFAAIVSRGCIALSGTVSGRQFSSMVKTESSAAQLFCHDFFRTEANKQD